MTDSPASKKSNHSEKNSRVPSEQEVNDSNGSRTSTPGLELRRGSIHHSGSGPKSNIVGVLRELKDDIVDNKHMCNQTGRSHMVSKRGPAKGMGDVYVEQNGRFIKAPKELLEHGDFNTREVYLEEIGDRLATPLDIALMVEKACSSLSRVLLGILAGAALLTVIIISLLMDSWGVKPILEIWPFLNIIAKVCHTLFMVMLTICLVSLLDWMDLAHTDARHAVDTLHWRHILPVLLIYFIAFILFLINAPSNDYIIWNMRENEFGNSTQLLEDKKDAINTVEFWKTITPIYCSLCVIGWLVVALTRNEDLFYIHLLSMKKYEASDSQMMFENEMARNRYN